MDSRTEKQQEILITSLNLISEKGIQGLTIRNLSLKLGISESAIYRHFENKIHIILALFDLMKYKSCELLESELNSNLTAVQKIEELFDKHFESFSKMPSLASVVFSEEIFRNDKRLVEKASETIAYNTKLLQKILQDAQRNKEIRTDISSECLSLIIMGTLRFFIRSWHFSEFSFDLKKEGYKLNREIKLLITKS